MLFRRRVNSHFRRPPWDAKRNPMQSCRVRSCGVPDFAMVEWTVRNDGADADALGDLGHKRGGIGLLSVDEHTAYIGKHYMDCVIRCNGSVFSARRVPVFIKVDSRHTLGTGEPLKGVLVKHVPALSDAWAPIGLVECFWRATHACRMA